jgi:uncharacterized RDD family membrane protein YckC
MPASTDRVNELLEGVRRNRQVIVSPEGIPIEVRIAAHGERLSAFALDMVFMIAVVVGLYMLCIPLFFSRVNFRVGMTFVLFVAFIVRNLYFLHFELAWQGRTPGKKICGLRVINRDGGALTPSALIARNLTREVEFFLPFSLFLNLDSGATAWRRLTLLGWTLTLTALPFFNRNHLRAGDLIGGTQVIAMPKRVLLDDLTLRQTPVSTGTTPSRAPLSQPALGTPVPFPPEVLPAPYAFTHQQLAIYGAFELQVLEEILRRPANQDSARLLEDVCQKIRRRIDWEETIAPGDVRRFLNDFYTAERANLERNQLFGHFKADKTTNLK